MKQRRFVVPFIIAAAVTLTGCTGKEEISRYPAVSVPRYGVEDYSELLSRDDPEVIVNAICNLGPEASAMGALLSKKDADKRSVKYRQAEMAYRRMATLVASPDPRIQTVALRFLQLFAIGYERAGELLALIRPLTPRTAQARYEATVLLARIAAKGAKVDTKTARQLLDDRSWLVARASYDLVNELADETLRAEIVRRYKRSGEEFERLLMLGALSKNYSARTFAFLSTELLASKSLRIRRVIVDMLPGAANPKETIDRLDHIYPQLAAGDANYLVQANTASMTSDFSATLLALLITHKRFVPGRPLYEKLYRIGAEYAAKKEKDADDAGTIRNIQRLEAAIASDPLLAAAWNTYRAEKEAARRAATALQKEYGLAVDRFKAETDALLVKYAVDAEMRTSFASDVDQGLKSYITEKILRSDQDSDASE